jgi:hypothetical protein
MELDRSDPGVAGDWDPTVGDGTHVEDGSVLSTARSRERMHLTSVRV